MRALRAILLFVGLNFGAIFFAQAGWSWVQAQKAEGGNAQVRFFLTESGDGTSLFTEMTVILGAGEIPSVPLRVPAESALEFGESFCLAQDKGHLMDLFSYESLEVRTPYPLPEELNPQNDSSPVFYLTTKNLQVHTGSFQDLMNTFPEELHLEQIQSIRIIKTKIIIGIQCRL